MKTAGAARVGVGIGKQETMGIEVLVLLLLIGAPRASAVSSSLPIGGGLW